MTQIPMYLVDTNVISELRKHSNANFDVQQFFQAAIAQNAHIYISVITLGELRRGIELIRYRGDHPQSDLLATWLQTILDDLAIVFSISQPPKPRSGVACACPTLKTPLQTASCNCPYLWTQPSDPQHQRLCGNRSCPLQPVQSS